MVFVAKWVRYDLPPLLSDHLARTWRASTPYEPNVMILEPGIASLETLKLRRLEGSGNWFAGNLQPSKAK